MVRETIFQHFIFQEFIFPFLLVFTILFAVLEKTKVLGDGKKQLNAIVAFVIGLIFVSAVFPKTVVSNLMLFLTVAIVIVFVILLLWGFIFADKTEVFVLDTKLKWALGIIAGISIVIAILWAVGLNLGVLDWLVGSEWSVSFWTNFAFITVVVIALAFVLKTSTGAK